MGKLKLSDISRFKELGVLGGWLLGIFLLGGLLWYGTQGPRAQMMIRSVNKILEAREDPRRLQDPLFPWSTPEQGNWFSLVDAKGTAAVFSVVAGGTFVPFAAMISPDGKVEELIPLTGNSIRMTARLSPETMAVYVRRIEAAELRNSARRGKK
jgi:diphthamide synthase subunit DPH2